MAHRNSVPPAVHTMMVNVGTLSNALAATIQQLPQLPQLQAPRFKLLFFAPAPVEASMDRGVLVELAHFASPVEKLMQTFHSHLLMV